MPWTPWRSTSSATRNASTIEVLRSSTDSSRLFGTTISVSTSSASASIPASAWSRRREPSNWNGRVTIPTVSAPSSRAICATIGAAPVPVPPPAPAAMKTMSEPRSSALIRSYSSLAAWRPRSGFEPEPSPRVIASPMCSVSCAADCWSDCRSVLIARNSTPSISASTIRLIAFTPAPPTPTTRSTGVPTGRAERTPRRRARAGRRHRARARAAARDRSAGRRSIRFSGMSAENAWRRRSWGVGIRRLLGRRRDGPLGRGMAARAGTGCSGQARAARARARSRRAGRLARAPASLGPGGLRGRGRRVAPVSSAVLRNRAASGPSRMLARLPVGI